MSETVWMGLIAMIGSVLSGAIIVYGQVVLAKLSKVSGEVTKVATEVDKVHALTNSNFVTNNQDLKSSRAEIVSLQKEMAAMRALITELDKRPQPVQPETPAAVEPPSS